MMPPGVLMMFFSVLFLFLSWYVTLNNWNSKKIWVDNDDEFMFTYNMFSFISTLRFDSQICIKMGQVYFTIGNVPVSCVRSLAKRIALELQVIQYHVFIVVGKKCIWDFSIRICCVSKRLCLKCKLFLLLLVEIYIHVWKYEASAFSNELDIKYACYP